MGRSQDHSFSPTAVCNMVTAPNDAVMMFASKSAPSSPLKQSVTPLAERPLCPFGNPNPELKFDMTPDGSTRLVWADWRREFKLAPEVSPKRAAYLYALMSFVQRELEKLGIRAYAEGGSLLGQARDGGIIRYDDDIDLQVHYEDKTKFLKATNFLAERVKAWGRAIGEDAELIWCRFGYKAVLFPKDDDMRVLRKPGSMDYFIPEDCVVDIFLMDTRTDADGIERICYSDTFVREMLAARGDGDICVSRLGSLPWATFGPTKVRVPEQTRDACKDQFGPHCFDRVVCKDGRNSCHPGGSVAVPMDAEAMALFHRLMEATKAI
jgi:hypothetical protein